MGVVMILLSFYCLYSYFCFIMTLNILIGLGFSISCRLQILYPIQSVYEYTKSTKPVMCLGGCCLESASSATLPIPASPQLCSARPGLLGRTSVLQTFR